MSLPSMAQVKNVHITLTRGMKGTYSWDVSVHDDDLGVVEQKVAAADEWLRSHYGGG